MDDKGYISVANMAEAKDILGRLRVPFFLFLGTALGAYRDQCFCPGDEDDVDFGIHDKFFPRVKEIISAFKEAGFEMKQAWVPKDEVAPEICFTRGGCKIDLFFITSDKDRSYWRFYQNPGATEYKTKGISSKYFDRFESVNFFDMDFNIPSPIEDYLEDNYGDWKTPIHRDNWDWLNSNKCPTQPS